MVLSSIFSRKVLIFFLLAFAIVYVIIFIASELANASIQNIKAPSIKERLNSMRSELDNPFQHKFNQTDFRIFTQSNCPTKSLNTTYKCLEALKTYDSSGHFPITSPSKVIYHHTYWTLDAKKIDFHARVMQLSILSFLATQTLLHTKLIVWTNEPLPPRVLTSMNDEFSNYIDKNKLEFKVLDLKNLCDRGVFKKKYEICTKFRSYGNLVAASDFVRFLVLYNYGGIYTDGDVFYLRDLKPFWESNFVYRWSYLEDYNTAVVGVRKEITDEVANVYAEALNNVYSESQLASIFHPFNFKKLVTRLYKDPFNNSAFTVYHSAIFDPIWLCNDGYVPRLKPKAACGFPDLYDLKINASEFDFGEFFPGAFTYHLHLGACGSCQIRPDSYFYHIESYFKRKIKAF